MLRALITTTALHAAKLEYNRDVRPILSDKCFKCHGPDSAARTPAPPSASWLSRGSAARL